MLGAVLAAGLVPSADAAERLRITAPSLHGAAGEERVSERQQRRRRRDRGELRMSLGGVEWTATRSRATIEGDRLEITASRLDGRVSEGEAVRQSIELHIEGYTGPGSYTVPLASRASLFLVVGLDVGGADTPGEMDTATVEALTQAQRLHLAGARVTIESADESQITGTFAWDRGNPVISDGRFRSLLRRRD